MNIFLLLLLLLTTRPAWAVNVQPPLDLPANTIDAGTKSLSALVSAIGSATKTLVVSQPLPALTGNLTIPTNVTLEFTGAGLISCGSYVVTIQSSTSDWPSRQIFANDCSSTGSVSLSGNSQVATILPAWWGAKSDGTTDDKAALRAALDVAFNSGGGIVYLPCGMTTYIDGTVYIDDNTTLTSCPSGSTIKRSNTSTTTHPNYSAACGVEGNETGKELLRNKKKDCSGSNIVVENIVFDTSLVDPGVETGSGPTSVSVVVILAGVSGAIVRNNTFLNCPQDCLFLKQGGGINSKILNNRFLGHNLLWGNGAAINIEMHSTAANSGKPEVGFNYVDSTGPTFCDGDGAKSCDDDGDCTGETPATCSSPGTGTRIPVAIQLAWVTGTDPSGGNIHDNEILISDRHTAINCSGCRDAIIKNNRIRSDPSGTSLSQIFTGIQVVGSSGKEAQDVTVEGNHVIGGGVANDIRALLVDGGAAAGARLKVLNNVVRNKSLASGFTMITLRNVNEAIVSGNNIDTFVGGIGLEVGVNSGTNVNINVTGNTISNGSGSTSYCVGLKGTTRAVVRNNLFYSCSSGGVVEVSGSPTGSQIGPNLYNGISSPVQLVAGGEAIWNEAQEFTFAQLDADAGDGSIIPCDACTIANPCASGGTGAIAKRLNDVWVCN